MAASKKKKSTTKENTATLYDASDVQARRGQTIEFYHLATGMSVSFKAWLTDFTDNYESNWNSEDVYGRMDPIQTFQGTKRVIEIGWQVVARSQEEAKDNMKRCSMLFQMLYPTFEGTAMKSPPLLKLRMMNLIQDVSAKASSITARDGGLAGTVSGFNYQPDLEDIVFDSEDGVIYPRSIQIHCSFTCLHSHEMGFKQVGDGISAAQLGFPYNALTSEDVDQKGKNKIPKAIEAAARKEEAASTKLTAKK